MWRFARKILFYDRTKFFVAVAGISASVLLVTAEVGLYLGFMNNASGLIDHSSADLWVAAKGIESFDFPQLLDSEVLHHVRATDGVAHAEPMLIRFGSFRRGDGKVLGVQVIGVDPGARLLVPWNITAGSVRELDWIDGVIVDESNLAQLDVAGVGTRAEISGARARIVGTTRGIRSFTTSPYVFANLRVARAYSEVRGDKISYVLVEAGPGTDLEVLRSRLLSIPNVTVLARNEFSSLARTYWSNRTGVAVALLFSACLGLIIGIVIVGQTLYNNTLEHIREYAILKAVGGSNRMVVRLIAGQALIASAVGYALGTGATFGVENLLRRISLGLVLTPTLLCGTAAITVVIGIGASLISIVKVLRLDPVSVFR